MRRCLMPSARRWRRMFDRHLLYRTELQLPPTLHRACEYRDVQDAPEPLFQLLRALRTSILTMINIDAIVSPALTRLHLVPSTFVGIRWVFSQGSNQRLRRRRKPHMIADALPRVITLLNTHASTCTPLKLFVLRRLLGSHASLPPRSSPRALHQNLRRGR